MRNIESIQIGDTLPERSYSPTVVDLFFHSAAMWIGHRIHYDIDYAKQVEGHPGLIVQGPLQGDWLSQCALEWMGENAVLLEFEYSNRQVAYVGDTLVSGGNVTAVDENSGEVEIELFIKNEAGEVVCPGKARVRLSNV